MTVTVTPAFLFDVERDKPVDAELLDGIGDAQLVDWEDEWMPELFKAVKRLRRAGLSSQHSPENLHWNWRNKAEVMRGLLAMRGFSVICGGITQGMMFVDMAAYRCRLLDQVDQHLVYIEFLESAPWNRKELLFDPPRFRGVGSLLIRAAIEVSREEGFKGRIGLHSLPQANHWYANSCGMTDLGVDPNKQDLRYFEMTVAQADAFISKGD